MKKALMLGLILVLAVSIVTAEEENYNQYGSLQLLFSLESGVDFVPTGPNQKVEFFQADISFFPKNNGYLIVNQLDTQETPPAEVEKKDYISFKWRNPTSNQIYYKINAKVKTQNKLQQIKRKIDFPVRNIEDSLLAYTKPTDFIDLTPEIEQQARSIISTEDDFYVMVFNLAEWTKKNVEYNLTSLTAEVVQKSSWVLQNRKGVCDELTNLFISMLRSVGVPSRFVSGMVYSNIDHQWGPHGWAEVYFPEIGWVPFDVTFGQYGWIDPSHIKLKESFDSGSPSAEYTWRAEGVQVKMGDIKVEATLVNAEGSKTPPIKINIQPEHAEARFGSFMPLLVTLENLEESYVSTSVIIKKAPGLTEKNVKEVLLKPGETKTLVWILEIPNGQSNYLYTASLEATTSFGNSAASKIHYGDEFKFFTREEAESYLAKSTQREVKKQLTGLQINCIPDQEIYYANDTATIACRLTNSRGSTLSVDICVQESCQTTNILASQGQTLNFEILARTNGRIPVIAENNEAVAYTYVELSTIPLPDVYISEVNPDEIDYHDQVILKFNLNSDTEVHDVTIDFGFDRFQLETFKGSREITIQAPGRNLRNGLRFTVSFLDEKDKPYNLEKAVYIKVNNAPFYAGLLDWVAELLGIY